MLEIQQRIQKRLKVFEFTMQKIVNHSIRQTVFNARRLNTKNKIEIQMSYWMNIYDEKFWSIEHNKLASC